MSGRDETPKGRHLPSFEVTAALMRLNLFGIPVRLRYGWSYAGGGVRCTQFDGRLAQWEAVTSDRTRRTA